MTEMLEKIETLTEKINTELKGMQAHYEELSGTVDDQQKEMSEKGGTLAKTREEIAAHEEQIANHQKSIEELKEMRSTVEALEKMMGRSGAALGEMPDIDTRTPGQKFAQSEQLKSMLEAGETASSKMPVEGIWEGGGVDRKAGTLTSAETGWGGMGVLWQPQELGEVIGLQRREFSIRDLMTVIPADRDGMHYIEETGYAPLYTEAAATGATGQAALGLKSTAGMFEGQKVTIETSPAQERIVAAGGINATTNVVTFTTNLTTAVAIGDPVRSDQMAMIPHGGYKPFGSLRFADKTVNIGTLATLMAIHQQTLDDGPALQAMIDNSMRYGLALAEEHQLLNGNGVGANLTGILTNANIQNVGAQPAAPATQIDHIRRALGKSEVAQYEPTGMLMHPNSWLEIELLKDSEDRYLWINLQINNRRVLFNVPVVTTVAITAPNFIVGAFKQACYLFDRQQASIQVTDSNRDWFEQNILALRAEQREGLAVVRPEALVKGTLSL